MNSDIQNYYKEVKDKYSNITLQQFAEICNSPFRMVKEVMNNNCLKDIRLQYLGSFKVSSFRINSTIGKLKTLLENDKITQESFDKKLNIYNEYNKIKDKLK